MVDCLAMFYTQTHTHTHIQNTNTFHRFFILIILYAKRSKNNETNIFPRFCFFPLGKVTIIYNLMPKNFFEVFDKQKKIYNIL